MNGISPKIKNLIKLKSIRITDCQITEIPDEIGYLTNLNYLDFRYNKINKISSKIKNLTRLEELRIGHNEITEVPPVLMFRKLKYLDISSNQITMIPEELSIVENKLKLEINKNKIKYIPSKALEVLIDSNIDDTAYDIDNLDINCEILIFNNLQKNLTNLPISLKQIYFKKDLTEHIKNFNIKIPFGCEIKFF